MRMQTIAVHLEFIFGQLYAVQRFETSRLAPTWKPIVSLKPFHRVHSARNECIESTSSVVSLWHSPPCPTTAPLHDMTVRKSAKITSTHWQLAGDIFSPEMTLNSLRPEIFFCCFLRANILRKTVFSKILITWKKTYDKKPSAAYKYCY